jgi:hypothetical protein
MIPLIVPMSLQPQHGGDQLAVFGPEADYSGVDLTLLVNQLDLSLSRPIGHHRTAHHRTPHHRALRYAGHHRGIHHVGPHHGELAVWRVATAHAVEYAVAPIGVQVVNPMGESSVVSTGTLFINSSPAPAAALAISSHPTSGRPRLTVTEWPNV